MAKDGGDFIASWAFYIHEIGIGALHQVFLLVFPLLFWRGMKKILCERHVLVRRSSPPERARVDFQCCVVSGVPQSTSVIHIHIFTL